MSKAWLALLSVGCIFVQQVLEVDLINNDIFATLALVLTIFTGIDLSNSVNEPPIGVEESERRYRSGRYRI